MTSINFLAVSLKLRLGPLYGYDDEIFTLFVMTLKKKQKWSGTHNIETEL